MLKNSINTLKKKAKEEATKESIRHRLSWSKVSKIASRVRAIAGTIGSVFMAASRIPGLNGDNKEWLTIIGSILIAVAGGAWLNKGQK